jgi:hypothetical protein
VGQGTLEEEKAVAVRAGDGAGDGAERAVGEAVVLEASGEHAYLQQGALVLPRQDGAGGGQAAVGGWARRWRRRSGLSRRRVGAEGPGRGGA